ncbi:MAG: hypothetical protein M3380_19230 [Chloroflexota bacterium]|nr:hypothetical protein [Chloroflexota bacterium]
MRWYLGYDLHEALPDHSRLSKIRDHYVVTIFRRFFDRIVEQCQKEGLVWGKELYLDSTLVEANADRDKMLPRFYVDAVTEHLAALFREGDTSQEEDLPGEPIPMLLPVDLPPDVEAERAAKNAARHDWIGKRA